MIKSKKLLKQKKISHGFFNKNGGKSKGIYKSLNCGPGSKDRKHIVKENLEIVKNKISKKSEDIFLVHQIHSNKYVFINQINKHRKKIKADAIITDQTKLPIAVLTADCVPILLYEKETPYCSYTRRVERCLQRDYKKCHKVHGKKRL